MGLIMWFEDTNEMFVMKKLLTWYGNNELIDHNLSLCCHWD